ncbi:hypothetical protein B0O99DRAFT_193421 [Bisporella sp. PMI_857]|nr:hypothetical protein B0O99DRAFT_193421 [Bisporella sp. PMI_857]
MLPEHETNTRRYSKHVRKLRMRYLGIVGLCLVLSITCTVIEVFAAFNIEYCDGEDLMQLYWGFWSVLQVGSNIAIFGVMLQLWIVLGNVQSPSWAVALGTPVLVFAALTWIFSEITKVVLKKCFHKDIADDEDTSDDESSGDVEGGRGEYNTTMEKWLSRAPTLVDSRRPSTILQAEVTRNGLGNGMLPRRNTLPL